MAWLSEKQGDEVRKCRNFPLFFTKKSKVIPNPNESLAIADLDIS